MVRWERVWEAQKYVLHFPNNKRKQRQDRVTELHLHCTSHWLLFWEEKGRQRVKALDTSQNCSSMLLIMFVGAQLGGLYQGWETKQVMLQSGICFLLIPVSSVLFAFRNQWATIMTDVPTSGCISCLEVHHIKVTFVLHGQLQLVLQVSYKDRDVSSLVLFPQSTVGTMSSQACLAELFEDRTRAREQELHFQWQQGHTNCM